MRIGIGVTTTPERDVLNGAAFSQFMPPDSYFTIFEDTAHGGIAYAKNRLLRQLDNCDHIFLFDDDCHPIAENWWRPYVEHPEPHLMYQFKLSSKPKTDMRELYRDAATIAFSHTRGAMLYIDRKVLDIVGGFDEKYNGYGYEHTDWTNRIHNAGLTSFRAMDVPNSHSLLYCLDQDDKVDSSLPDRERKQLLAQNYKRYRTQLKSKEFREYRK